MNLTDGLVYQLGLNHFVVKTNTGDVSHEESFRRPPDGGNSMNWVLGHILVSRNGLLKVLDLPALPYPEDQLVPYQRGSEPLENVEATLDFEKMVANFDTSQKQIVEAIQKIPAEKLDQKAPFSPINNEDETVGSLLAALVYHESYHSGQLGMLRHVAGKEGAIR